MTIEEFMKLLNDRGCSFTGPKNPKYTPAMQLFGSNLSVSLLRDDVGVSFYSDTELDDIGQLNGPWLATSLLTFFNNMAGVDVRVPKRRKEKEKAMRKEGSAAECFLSVDEKGDNGDLIRQFGEKLAKFILGVSGDKKEVAEGEREKFNRENDSFLKDYAARRGKSGDGLSIEEMNALLSSPQQRKVVMRKDVKAEADGMIGEIQSLLEENLNLVLTGAPGTGKTFMAKEVAKDLAEDEWEVDASGKGKWKNGRIASVQFHPGYDYSDFVIGMKPVLICEENGKEVFRDKVGLYTKKDEKKEEESDDNKERLLEGWKTKVSFQWTDGIFKKFADKAKGDPDHNYVFLIDEINRADLSRVFGELFSLLEEEYRYLNENGTGITLPNGEHFVIPKNLYIIGTMNDIDRSVESMDFALRRRFAWYEVTADKSECILDATDKKGIRKVSQTDSVLLKSAMRQLNAIIGGKKFKVTDESGSLHDCELRLGIEYQLGGAIFTKLEKYVKRDSEGNPQDADKGGEGAFEKLWQNHIENILKEYLRGRSNRKELLKGLKQVFDDAIKGEIK